MEKLAYVLKDSKLSPEDLRSCFDSVVVPAIRRQGGHGMDLLLTDLNDTILVQAPLRIFGDFEDIAAICCFWLPSVDDRMKVEKALLAVAETCWGYLVTESTVVACSKTAIDGDRMSGVSQFTLLTKPAEVALETFHAEWAKHSKLTFEMHPLRESYDRNYIVRRLTTKAPEFLGFVVERFPSLEVFVDDDAYFGDREILSKIVDHLASFYDFQSAIGAAVSEYRWA